MSPDVDASFFDSHRAHAVYRDAEAVLQHWPLERPSGAGAIRDPSRHPILFVSIPGKARAKRISRART